MKGPGVRRSWPQEQGRARAGAGQRGAACPVATSSVGKVRCRPVTATGGGNFELGGQQRRAGAQGCHKCRPSRGHFPGAGREAPSPTGWPLALRGQKASCQERTSQAPGQGQRQGQGKVLGIVGAELSSEVTGKPPKASEKPFPKARVTWTGPLESDRFAGVPHVPSAARPTRASV